jgi:hypothetical protein
MTAAPAVSSWSGATSLLPELGGGRPTTPRRFSPACCPGLHRGLVAANPCERGGRLYRAGGRAEKVWTAADEAGFLKRAPAHLHLALLLALWTGQRQGNH